MADVVAQTDSKHFYSVTLLTLLYEHRRIADFAVNKNFL